MASEWAVPAPCSLRTECARGDDARGVRGMCASTYNVDEAALAAESGC